MELMFAETELEAAADGIGKDCLAHVLASDAKGVARVACNRPLLEGYRLLDRDEPLAPAHMRTSKYGRLRRGRQDGSIHQGKG